MANKKATVTKAKSSISITYLQNKIYDFVENNSVSTVQKGERFCEWILKYIFERTDDESEIDMSIGGKSDNSIDAWFDDGNTLSIIQSKYSSSHSYAGMCQQIEDMKRLLCNPYNYVGNNSELKDFSDRLSEYVSFEKNNENDESSINEKNIVIYYITNETLTSEIVEKVRGIKIDLENAFRNVSYISMGINDIQFSILKSLQQLPEEYRKTPTKLMLKNYFKTQETYVAEVPLKELARFIYKNRKFLFFSNVRNYLNDTNINCDIAKTFKESPCDFWYYNNGITIICDQIGEIDKCSNVLPIYAPQIVNGCQTASTIHKQFYNKTKEERNLQEGTILVKIIQDKNGKKKNGIIKYTNSQNTVSAMDFFALDEFHKKLKLQFAEYGYNYEIQRKESVFQKEMDKQSFKNRYCNNSMNKVYSYLFPKSFKYVLPVKQVVQAYAAGMHFMVVNATSRSGNLAPGKEASKKMFNDITSEKNVLTFLYPYAVMQYGKNYLGYASPSKSIESSSRRRNNNNYKKPCLMFFVSIYFRMLVRFLRKLDIGAYSKTENDNPLNIKFEILKTIFENKDLNIILLNTADSVLEAFFDDSEVKRIYEDNIPKFLKSDVEKEPSIEVLNGKIDSAFEKKLSDNEYDLLYNTVKNVIK